jgi:molybdopterin-guanine dinucleotide biosynthesis protein MobB
MRIINIIGHSGSGKTTLIAQLVPLLAAAGTVATIKHMGHHVWELPPGKDTTMHYAGGSLASAGIDAEKTMITCRTTDVREILDFYVWKGIDYAVVEGFKEEGFSAAVLGGLAGRNVIMRDPTAQEIFAGRERFDEYVPGKARKV